MSKWIKEPTVSCGKILRWRANVVECKCPKCKRWCVNWADRLDYDFCPNCGKSMKGDKKGLGRHKPKTVTIMEEVPKQNEKST